MRDVDPVVLAKLVLRHGTHLSPDETADSNDRIRIALAAGCTDGLNLAPLNRLVKASLLYADVVEVNSLFAFVYSQLSTVGTNITGPTAPLVRDLYELFYDGDDAESHFHVIDEFLASRNRRPRNRKELLARLVLRRLFAEIGAGIEKAILTLGDPRATSELFEAVQAGHVRIRPFTKSDFGEEMIYEYVDSLFEITQDARSLPLLDNETAALLRECAENGLVGDIGSQDPVTKHGAAASLLFDRLPLPDGSLVDVLRAKDRLAGHLARFRSEMMKFSVNIESSSWDRDFEIEVERLYHREIAPIVEEITADLEANALWRHGLGALTQPLPAAGASFIGVSIANMFNIGTAAAAGLTGCGIALAAQTVNSYAKEGTRISGNHLYYYQQLSD
jgi:hypothetical protein